ncbi:MAG: beta-lactamase family protein [bacterium]|nr:beta-lactamase family protein [bacterium]
MNAFRQKALMILIMVVVISPTYCKGKKAAPVFPKDKAAQLQAALDESAELYGDLGVQMAVRIPSGAVWTGVHGSSDLAGTPIKIQNRSRWGSVTKPLTATLILQLVGEGKLSLDDTLGKLQPVIFNVVIPDDWKPVTLREMLQHTSGIFNYTGNLAFYYGYNYWMEKQRLPQNLVKLAIPVARGPSGPKNWSYSNTNYVLLGMIAEGITATTYETLITKRILEPLGMKSTLFPITPNITKPFNNGYQDGFGVDAKGSINSSDGQLVPAEITTTVSPTIAFSAGAIVTDVEDMMKWTEALVTGSLLSKKLHEEQFHPAVPTGQLTEPPLNGAFYGLGVARILDFYGHTGGIAGYESIMLRNKAGYAVLVVGNGLIPIQAGKAYEKTGQANLAVDMFVRFLYIFDLAEKPESKTETGAETE